MRHYLARAAWWTVRACSRSSLSPIDIDAQGSLELCKSFLDGVKFWAVGWEKEQTTCRTFDCVAPFIAWTSPGYRVVPGSVALRSTLSSASARMRSESGIDLRKCKCAKTWHRHAQTCLIDDGEARWIGIKLAVEPVLATPQEVGALLLQCICILFENPTAPSQSDIESAGTNGHGLVFTQSQDHFVESSYYLKPNHQPERWHQNSAATGNLNTPPRSMDMH